MNMMQRVSSYEYKNDFLYIIIRQAPELGPKTYLFCSGINTTRFDPLCWGKAGICSNPAFKGLQQMRADVSGYALAHGFSTRPADGIDCSSLSPHGDGWYRESMLITGASAANIKAVLEFSVTDLVKTVLYVCAPHARVPVKQPNPPAMQKWLESYAVKDYIAAAPPPIARLRDQK